MCNAIVTFTIILGVISGAFAPCPLGQTGDTVNLCRAPGKDLCTRLRSDGDCLNVGPYPYYSGFITGESALGCIWYTQANCNGYSLPLTKEGWSSNFGLAIKSVYCWCH